MMAACDTFRSGAVEQLRTHARRLQVYTDFTAKRLMQCMYTYYIHTHILYIYIMISYWKHVVLEENSLFRSLYLRRAMRKILPLWQKKQFRKLHAMVQMWFLLIQLAVCR